MSANLNTSVKASLHRQLKKDPTIKNQTRMVVEKQFRIALDKFISEFEKHPLTRELKSGPGSSNVTGTLRSGNLFGFIGFNEDYDPISPIENRLRSTGILIKGQSMGPKGFVSTFSVSSPTMSELYKLTPIPWAKGGSWLEQIEGSGISGLGQYMNKTSSSSRSGAGIQLKNLNTSGRLKIPYLKIMLKEFEKNLNKISGATRLL